MPPRLPRIASGRLRLTAAERQLSNTSKCLICEFNSSTHKPLPRRRPAVPRIATAPRPRRQLSTAIEAEKDAEIKPIDPKKAVEGLKKALIDLQKDAGSYVNIPRLQLALRGVEQQPGQETIRVAVVGLAGQGKSISKSRELIRLLLADPLKAEEEWERVLTTQSGPVLLKISNYSGDAVQGGYSNRLVQELNISSPTLNGHHLEILVLDGEVLSEAEDAQETITDRVLVPIIDIPVSNTGRYSPITAPVHKALIFGDGIIGAASLLKLPSIDRNLIVSAVDLPGYVHEEDLNTSFQPVDVALGSAALQSFRQSIDNAMDYEHHWSASGLPVLRDWLKAGSSTSTSLLKPPVQALITSVLASTEQKIQSQESRQLSTALSSKVPSSSLQSLHKDLDAWGERAHTELRDQLDAAFSGRRWRALAWWKLFWRVDDVSAITSDVLASRFLPAAEQEAIYLAGKIAASGVLPSSFDGQNPRKDWAYKDNDEPARALEAASSDPANHPRPRDVLPATDTSTPLDGNIASPAIKPQPWPLHIPVTRAYLAGTTIPRLQALAQKLVAQTLATSAFSGAFAGLVYATNLSVGVYEAGAVAALGTVWGLRRMQAGWEGARGYWEGEVREDGRRAVRGVEGVVGEVLKEAGGRKAVVAVNGELGAAREAVERARRALEALDRRQA